jgi:hypothetical protein
VKIVRFSNVVQKAGKPETHLVLVEPSKDRALQAAIKAQRVMTVQQAAVGSKTDRGEVGFNPGGSRQFLVFPKSLRAFVGRTVVGIKYDLLSAEEVPEKDRVPATRPPKKKPAKAAPVATPKSKRTRGAKPRPEKTHKPMKLKVVPFKAPPAREDPDEDDDEVAALKKQVRHAMAVLEDGKAVAAFNLLKRIVGD